MRKAWVGLARRAKEGDIEAFEGLVDRFKRPLCAAIHPLVRDWHLTQDVAQETFAAVFVQLGDLRDPECFRSYLFRVARNRAVECIRSLTAARTRSLDALTGAEGDGAFPWGECRVLAGGTGRRSSPALLERIRRVVTALPNGYGSLLNMRYVEGMSIAEIGRVLGRTPSAVKAVLYRARLTARRVLRRAGLDPERILNEV